jgi:hypothetical protein
MSRYRVFILVNIIFQLALAAKAATTQRHYFGHDAVEDKYGVIAPWYKGQNGQYDFRVRIAAETMKRYPWVGAGQAVAPAPAYVYDGTWSIDSKGKITVVPEKDWANGDLGQRAAYILGSMIDYYTYSGDPAAFAIISSTADYLVDHCETSSSHGWPNFLISVPTMGVRYGDCRLGPSDDLTKGNGKIQLDIVAEVGLQLTRAYEMMGDVKWYNAAKHWGDLLAENRRRDPGAAPWGRYANNADGNSMNDIQTGGIAFTLTFFDELVRTGYTGTNDSISSARDAGRKYLQDVLLPAWAINDVWGRNYWDWEDPVQAQNVTEFLALYLMDHKDYFPNSKNDVRNIVSLFLNHTSVSPKSNGEAYSGAWAYPESSECCDRSLWYGTMAVASVFARYGVQTDSEWAREIARRSQLLVTYDVLDDGESMDLIDGGSYVNKSWFKIAHPMALLYQLRTMAWLPELMGANRENHIMRSSGAVKKVIYGKDKIDYFTFDAPPKSIDVLRLAYSPTSVSANGNQLAPRSDLAANGYTLRSLEGGDVILSIRHDGATDIGISGPDPQTMVDDKRITFDSRWRMSSRPDDYGGGSHVASQAGAAMTYTFKGNQVRLVGRVSSAGGLADVYVDGIRQLVPIDCYSPGSVPQQILYYKTGLTNGLHTLRIVARGQHTPLSKGDEVYVDGLQYSDATGDSGFGEGGGPTEAQRMIFGYTDRADYIDSGGEAWRPATEFIVRTGDLTDSVAKTWWIMRQAVFVKGTSDPELYRYGVHWADFTVNVTVGPGSYHARLKFAETQYSGANQRSITIFINGRKVAEDFDVFATAGGANKAVDLVFNDLEPQNGVLSIRFVGNKIVGYPGEATVQAVEVGPGNGGAGATPKRASVSSASHTPENTAIVYIQAVRYKPSVTRDRATQLSYSLEQTFVKIPEVRSVRVGSVAEDSSKDDDYAVLMEFNSLVVDKKSYGESEAPPRLT